MRENEKCPCGHDHDHDHDHAEHCHEGHDHAGCCGCAGEHEHIHIQPVADLSILMQNMMLALYERKYLPLARFAMCSTQDEEVYAVALEPVYLGSAKDTLEQVKALGDELSALAAGGLIELDYDIPLGGYAYGEYEQADIYRYFVDTVRQGGEIPGALFDCALLEKGSMALTRAGAERVAAMLPK